MQQLALISLLTLHLLCMNVASAGPLVAIWFDWQEGRGQPLAGQVGRYLTVKSAALLVVGSLFGLAIGGLLWDAAYQATLLRFRDRIEYAVWEYLFSLCLIVGVAVWWARGRPHSTWQRWGRIALLFLAGTNLLYHFPLLFIVISDAATSSPLRDAPVDGAEFRQLIVSGSVMSRAMHFVVAAFAVNGLVLMAYGSWKRESSESSAASRGYEQVIIAGGRLALAATLVQLPIGIWLTTQLRPAQQKQLLGSDLISALLLGVSIAAVLWLLHLLSSVALGDTTRKSTRQSIAVMVSIVAMMTGVVVRLAR